jgi:hypothetical protein
MTQTTATKFDAVKTAAKGTEAKVVAKVEETKTVVKGSVAEKKEAGTATVKNVAKNAAKDVAAETKAVATKVKETAKTKKSTKTAKSTSKDELKPEVFIQFYSSEAVVAEVVEKVKSKFVEEGHRASTIKSLQVYLKPEENAAYYVINQKTAGRVDLF